jgi:hypothetical protein
MENCRQEMVDSDEGSLTDEKILSDDQPKSNLAIRILNKAFSGVTKVGSSTAVVGVLD